MKFQAKSSKLAVTLSVLGVGLLVGDAAMADSLGTILDRGASQNFLSANNFITGFMYLAGVGMGAAGVFKLRDYMKDSDRNSLKLPAGLLIAASLALALPSYLKTGVDTTFGQGNATLNTLQGSQLGR
jgi:hypothetical protein